jgi:ATP-dependent RNA helicase RhlE
VLFVSKKLKVKDVVPALRKKGFQVAAMHSDLNQKEREETMNAFKAGRINVLVATDIVSRGIDISGIQLVINFDMPHDPEDYVHRVGRTARADHDGESVTLVSANDRKELLKFGELETFLEKKLERIPVPKELGGCDEAEVMKGLDAHGRKPHRNAGPRQGGSGPRQGNSGPRQGRGPRNGRENNHGRENNNGKRNPGHNARPGKPSAAPEGPSQPQG